MLEGASEFRSFRILTLVILCFHTHVEPLVNADTPVWHLVHAVAPALAETYPLLHGMQADEDEFWPGSVPNVPGEHFWQRSCESIPANRENVLARQGWHATVRLEASVSEPHFPAGQGSWRRPPSHANPASHGVHSLSSAMPILSVYFPGGQSWHSAPSKYCPNAHW